MNLRELIEAHEEKKGKQSIPHRLRDLEYRRHYPLIRDAVKERVPLHAAIQILREKEDAFHGRSNQTVHQAFRRALIHDGIGLKEK